MSVQYIDLRLTRTTTGFALDLGPGVNDDDLFNPALALAMLVESGALDEALNAFPAAAYAPRLTVVKSD